MTETETITQDTESVHSRRQTELDDDINHFLSNQASGNVNVIFFDETECFPKHLLQIILLQDVYIWFCYDILTFISPQIRLFKKCYLLTGIENEDIADIDGASVQY